MKNIKSFKNNFILMFLLFVLTPYISISSTSAQTSTWSQIKTDNIIVIKHIKVNIKKDTNLTKLKFEEIKKRKRKRKALLTKLIIEKEEIHKDLVSKYNRTFIKTNQNSESGQLILSHLITSSLEIDNLRTLISLYENKKDQKKSISI